MSEQRQRVCPVCGFDLDNLSYPNRPFGQTPLQAAALDALVAWRKADLAARALGQMPRARVANVMLLVDSERALRDAADRVLAELGVQG